MKKLVSIIIFMLVFCFSFGYDLGKIEYKIKLKELNQKQLLSYNHYRDSIIMVNNKLLEDTLYQIKLKYNKSVIFYKNLLFLDRKYKEYDSKLDDLNWNTKKKRLNYYVSLIQEIKIKLEIKVKYPELNNRHINYIYNNKLYDFNCGYIDDNYEDDINLIKDCNYVYYKDINPGYIKYKKVEYIIDDVSFVGDSIIVNKFNKKEIFWKNKK